MSELRTLAPPRLLLRATALAGIALSFALPGALYGQVNAGAIVGVVRNAQGAAVSGAVITIEGEGASRRVALLTNREGGFAVRTLRPGKYQIKASVPGFRVATKSGVELGVQGRLNVEFRLEPSSDASQVTVGSGVWSAADDTQPPASR